MGNAIPFEPAAGAVIVFDEGESLSHVKALAQELRLQLVDGLQSDLSESITSKASFAIVNEALPHAVTRWEALPRSLPAIKMSDDNSFTARLRAARKGIDGIVRTPLTSDELNVWVHHFLQKGHGHSADVLIVDDDDVTREVNSAVLENAGLNVMSVASAKEAFEALQSQHVDIILLDVQMPDVDGIEFARIVRQNHERLSLPIIFLSSERDPSRQLEARRFGGDDFILKPVAPRRLADIVQLRLERSNALKSLIERDSLTGLLNHAQFHARLEKEVERSRRTRANISVVLVDLDHFKSVNDTYGHQVGDRVIRSLATLLTNSLRKTDLVGRLGGEEFAAVLLDTDPQNAATVIDRIRETFEATAFEAGNSRFHKSFSAGISAFSNASSASELVRLADNALYKAKADGRARTVLSTDCDDALRAAG